tara:strand:- start:470 stop:640 length:171 start_codon:yes stop_codon:yes gene_type:complete
MITMKEIKDFYGDRGSRIKTEKTSYSGRSYKIGDDDFPYTRKGLEQQYLNDKNTEN